MALLGLNDQQIDAATKELPPQLSQLSAELSAA
jgi:hypothetical protein